MKHGYGCPYHYGPIDFGPEAPNDYGEDCRCEVCVAPEIVIEVKTYRSFVRLSFRARLRNWWRRRRWRREVVPGLTYAELDAASTEELERAMLYGREESRAMLTE